MNELQRLLDRWSNDPSLDVKDYNANERAVVEYLRDHPELDAPFFERFVSRPTAEGGEVGTAVILFSFIGRERPFDHKPLLGALYRDDVEMRYKLQALFCITQIADHLDEQVLFDLMDNLPAEFGHGAVHDTINALDYIRDRNKAIRLLRRCLKATDKTSTNDGRTMRSLLDSFVNRINGNDDIYQALLHEPLPPHQAVIVAVTLMRETLPADGPLRAVADQAAARSTLADDFYNLYVGTYVAPKAK
jgi:hypothetical protein